MSDQTEGAEVEALDWEVFDMAHDHRLCLNDAHEAEFGPMTEAKARAMVATNPRGYWARQIPRAAVVAARGAEDGGESGHGADARLHFGYLSECSDGPDCERQGCLKAHVETRIRGAEDGGEDE